MLTVTDLRKKFKKYEVLRGLNMRTEKGEVYGFLGKNGCGKTTTMNIICNIIAKDGGKIAFDAERRPKIGYLTETPALFTYMNGYEYLEYIAASANYKGDVNKRVAETLALTGMTEGGRRRVKGYSRGMVQRLGIAAAIFDSPELLVLDEPTSALDPEGRAEVMRVIGDLKSAGTTIILCTHIISDVERVADRIGIMKDGVIIREGSMAELVGKGGQLSRQITVTLAEPDEAAAVALRGLPKVTASDYNAKNGMVSLISDDADGLYLDMVSLIAEKKIKISELVSRGRSLEDVYLEITGSRGRA